MVAHQSSLPLRAKDILTAIRENHRPTGQASQPASPEIKELQGGLNNTVYTYLDNDKPVCIKIYRVDDRHRAEREWNALQFLAVHRPNLAPTPYWFDADPEFPAVGMVFMEGQPLCHTPITPRILDALADALHRLYTIELATHPYPFMRVGGVTECLRRIELWATQLESDPDNDLVEQIHPIVLHWLQSNDRSILRDLEQPVFARGDPNLANCLWDGVNLRLIDLEYAGWSDIAFELADLVEHINSRSVTDEAWNNFVTRFILPESRTYQRFRAAQRTCALLWLVILWPHRNARQSSLNAQIERIRLINQKKE